MNVLLNAPKDAIANKPMFLLYFAAVFCPQTYLFLYVFFFTFSCIFASLCKRGGCQSIHVPLL